MNTASACCVAGVEAHGAKTAPAPGPAAAERRRAVRFPIERQVRYRFGRDPAVRTGSGRTIDISSWGVRLEANCPVETGESARLWAEWPVRLDDHPLLLFISGLVLRSTGAEIVIGIDRYEFRVHGRAEACAR